MSFIIFIKKIKDMGLLVKLDTNGTNPEMLKQLIDQKLVDYIAMDIKAPIERYKEITNTDIDVKNIKESIRLLCKCNIDCEFRTTVVPTLLAFEDMKKAKAFEHYLKSGSGRAFTKKRFI